MDKESVLNTLTDRIVSKLEQMCASGDHTGITSYNYDDILAIMIRGHDGNYHIIIMKKNIPYSNIEEFDVKINNNWIFSNTQLVDRNQIKGVIDRIYSRLGV